MQSYAQIFHIFVVRLYHDKFYFTNCVCDITQKMLSYFCHSLIAVLHGLLCYTDCNFNVFNFFNILILFMLSNIVMRNVLLNQNNAGSTRKKRK